VFHGKSSPALKVESSLSIIVIACLNAMVCKEILPPSIRKVSAIPD